jgi:hypothetical protein
MSTFEVLVNKAMFDSEFATQLKTNPAAALRVVGIEPTPERLAAIAAVNLDAVADAARAIGTSQKTTPN